MKCYNTKCGRAQNLLVGVNINWCNSFGKYLVFGKAFGGWVYAYRIMSYDPCEFLSINNLSVYLPISLPAYLPTYLSTCETLSSHQYRQLQTNKTGFFPSFPTFCFSMETSTVSDLAFIIFNALTDLLNPSLSSHSLSCVASLVPVLLALTCELPGWTPVEVCILGMTTALARKNTLGKFLILFPAQPWRRDQPNAQLNPWLWSSELAHWDPDIDHGRENKYRLYNTISKSEPEARTYVRIVHLGSDPRDQEWGGSRMTWGRKRN